MPLARTISRVCRTSDYKEYDPAKYHKPHVRWSIGIPTEFPWASWTLTQSEINGDGDLIISTGGTLAIAVSPSLMNVSRNANRFWATNRIKMTWSDTLQTGKIRYFASNDGGTAWRIIKTQDAEFKLNYGREPFAQAKYNDLRIKIEIERTLTGDTTPSVQSILAFYNKVKP